MNKDCKTCIQRRKEFKEYLTKEGIVKDTNTPHDLIMAVYETRIERKKAESNRAHVNIMEGYRLREECNKAGKYYSQTAALNTDASKAAHKRYTEAANAQAAAMRALMKYGREHDK